MFNRKIKQLKEENEDLRQRIDALNKANIQSNINSMNIQKRQDDLINILEDRLVEAVQEAEKANKKLKASIAKEKKAEKALKKLKEEMKKEK